MVCEGRIISEFELWHQIGDEGFCLAYEDDSSSKCRDSSGKYFLRRDNPAKFQIECFEAEATGIIS